MHIIIYVCLCVASAICGWVGIKKNQMALMRAMAVVSIVAAVVLVFGGSTSSSGTLYISGASGTTGIGVETLLKLVLYVCPPIGAGAISAVIAAKG